MPFVVPDRIVEPLYCIVPVFNPFRWKSRWKHTERAIKHFMDAGAVVYLVEAAFGRREFAFADSGLDGLSANCGMLGQDHRFRHKYIGLRTRDELWLKEALINIGVSQLPYDWAQVCWIDSDVQFLRPNWVGECIHKLQHYAFLQMFSHARDLGPNYEMLPEDYPHADGPGFVHAWRRGTLNEPVKKLHCPECNCKIECVCSGGRCVCTCEPDPSSPYDPYGPYPYAARVWPGLAWAATRPAWEAVGGLMDFAVWGGADYHQSLCLIGETEKMMRDDLHRNYKTMVLEWYRRCSRHIRQNVGVMEGSVVHNWHGRKTSRGYVAKHTLLAKIGFDPLHHLKRDYQGLWQLHDDGSEAFIQLRDTMRRIALERDEDSSDIRINVGREQGH